MHAELASLLYALDGVQQNPIYHPERDALFHSLQVFQLARRETEERALWAAALLHDVGKADRELPHDQVGAWMLDGLVSDRVVWLVRHHLDLLVAPGRTRRRFRGTRELADLERLRRWDLAGRDPHQEVLSPEAAIDALLGDHHDKDIRP